MIDPNDDLGDVLAPRPGQHSSGLREKLLRRTESRLVRQRWVRRSVQVGALASIFVMGGLAGWLARPAQTPERIEATAREVVFVPVPVAVPVASAERASSSALETAQKLSGSQTELRAELEDDHQLAAKLYRSAGDAFLHEQDYSNAARCYRQYLVRAGDTALALAPDDSWLLTSLKNAAFKEKPHVPKTGS